MKRLPFLFLVVILSLLTAACNSVDNSALHTEARKAPKVGHMTGSFKVDIEGVRYTGTVNLYCDPSQLSKGRNLQVNWPGHRWHLSKVALHDVSCFKKADPRPPVADWNLMMARATGTLNGHAASEITFVFSDKGEPGHQDTVSFVIRNAKGELVAQIPESNLTAGSNLQAHFGQDDGEDGGGGFD